MIRAVLFDVGGTLAVGELDKKIYQQGMLDLLESFGLRVSGRELRRAVGVALNQLNQLRAKHLEMDFREFRRLTLLRLGITPTDELLEAMASLYYRCFKIEPTPRCKEVLDTLSKRYLLGVVSNTMSLASKRFLEANGLSGYFKAQVYSGEVGYRKPHPKIFQIALERLGTSPAETVHVGNLPGEDVKGPKALGMRAILLRGHDPEADAVIRSLTELPEVLKRLEGSEGGAVL